ncbi:efflux RND transporter periplasmic adaptor subunit [Ectothiorhodospira shaposhnikovii]|uniref:efflux RND transporter periplasmic adaptor subunit n=1 Tax=Ectothiorhodospira shaposhnikovii TaxID=1054 RepID=UPI001EE957FD|nr:efflux RND transporter periplasmic adaptor subunit [Ectothiorhodospira shaposhnikovii]MCG5512598.1 efflux RND transporter periplasmic adaptor subunit [Ectothiorhodospira shaposhnikovii]
MNKKRLLTAAAAAALVLLILLLFRLGGEEDASRAPASQRGSTTVPVAVAPITRGDITERVVFTGSLVAAHRVEVATRIAGRLEHLHVDIGDAVAPGTLLAELDDDEVVQNLEQARAELAVARASLGESQAALAAARRALTRTQELRAQRIASQSELEAAQTELEAQQARVALARSQIDQRQAAVRNAEIRQAFTRIHADAKAEDTQWLVADRFVDRGSILQANTPILALVDLTPLRARVFVTERDYARLAPGQPVTLTTIAYPGETFTGWVERLSPEFREASRQARVEIHVPNEDQRLRPGMFVEARITTRALSDVTLVPVDALVERQGRSGLFLVEATDAGPTARFIPVDTGIEERDRVQIISPALEGRVVTLGHHLISDGTRLRPVERDEPDQAQAGSTEP